MYGSLGETDAPFCETTAYAPNSPYAASKAASDHLVRAYLHTYGMPTLTTNCSNNYGPFQFPEKLIPLVILNALKGKALPVYGDGKNVRDWLYVERPLRRHPLACCTTGVPGETYNIGGRSEQPQYRSGAHHLRDARRAAPRLAAKPHADLISFVTDRPGHDRRYAIDAAEIDANSMAAAGDL